MEQPSPHLIRGPKGAFTLVELLIALSLVSVVMGLAWIVLDSTRKVAEEISTEIQSPVESFWSGIQTELDRLLPSPFQSEIPGIRFSDETGLEMVSLFSGPEGVPLQTEVHYFIEDNNLLKVTRRSFPPLSQTNQIAQNVSILQIRGHKEEEEIEFWPTEPEQALPPRISVDLTLQNGSSLSREFYLPASFRYKKPLVEENNP